MMDVKLTFPIWFLFQMEIQDYERQGWYFLLVSHDYRCQHY